MEPRRKLKSATILFVSFLLAAGNLCAQTLATNSYFQEVDTDIPDDNPNGIFSTNNVNGLSGIVSDVSVGVDIASGFNGDLYAWLTGPTGEFAVLLNRVGVVDGDPFGYSDSGFDVIFTTTATNDIHFYQSLDHTLNEAGQLTGTWAPDGRNIDPGTNAAVLGSTVPTAILSSFLGTDPNGEWTLFLADFSGGSVSTWLDWQLQIETVPEPAASQLLLTCGTLGAAFIAWRKSRRDFRM
jgi:subtilisin-like proprotein convertase family protein